MKTNNAILAARVIEHIGSIKLDESKIATMEVTSDGEIKVSVQNRITHECYDIITIHPDISTEEYQLLNDQIIHLLESHKQGSEMKASSPSDNWSVG